MTVTARRINRGRGHSYEIDGERVLGATTIIDRGVPKPALINWAGKVTAGYAVDHWDELTELSVSKRLDAIGRARFEERDQAAVRGTNVHKLAERLAAGEQVDVPDELAGHVDSYLRFVDEWKPEELLVEVPCFHRTLGYACTPDLVADLADGKRWLLDWKTSQSGIFPEFALQLAAARYAEFTIDDQGVEIPVPKVDATGCVWLRADGYDLIPVAADTDAFRVFLHAKHVALYTDEARERWVGDALLPPVASENGGPT